MPYHLVCELCLSAKHTVHVPVAERPQDWVSEQNNQLGIREGAGNAASGLRGGTQNAEALFLLSAGRIHQGKLHWELHLPRGGAGTLGTEFTEGWCR